MSRAMLRLLANCDCCQDRGQVYDTGDMLLCWDCLIRDMDLKAKKQERESLARRGL